MKVHHLTQDAQSTVENNLAVIHGVTAQEAFRKGDLSVISTPKSEMDFYPESVYMIRTNLCIEGVRSPHQIVLRPTFEAFHAGFEVKRVEISSTNGELIVFIGVLNQRAFKRMTPLFEVIQLGTDSMPTHEPAFNFSVNKPKDLPTVTIRSNERAAAAAPPPIPVNEIKRVNDWLDSAEVKPERIGTANDTRPPLTPTMTPEQVLATSRAGQP